MSILSTEIEDIFVVMPNGRFDSGNDAEASTLVLERIDGGTTRVIFDFSRTDYISSAGLRVILLTAKRLRGSGQLALCNSNEQLHEVLEISGFLDILHHSASLPEAVEFVSQ